MEQLRHHGEIWRRAAARFFEHDGFASAGNMAFIAMLSLFPFVIFLVAVSGFMGQTERGVAAITFMMNTLPHEVGAALSGPINGVVDATRPEILTGSIVFAIWTAATGVETARGVLVKAFGREHARAAWLRRLESLAVVIFAAISILVAMSILVIGPAVVKAVTSFFPEALTGSLTELWNFLNLFLGPVVLAFGLFGVYLALTPRRLKRPYRLPGTLLALVILIATAKGLSLYLRYAGNYDVTYGSLAGVVVTQLFCFLVSLGFVAGAELNAAYTLDRLYKEKTAN
ncbi:YihY/virulence factor BrkB family protein [Gimibacter soli]|uniref:YihY/virulence factor BrkB family protein n=1 Tax=Gimibacter soli TaxID=3024400 RepID=A0AAE9XMA6_9PROT|nr:YihY/virulence factor BrkB family protein [Gimibacter soli]WCL52642.1 YihY/virulence factor BrkB family protein [Gimibacter soli]